MFEILTDDVVVLFASRHSVSIPCGFLEQAYIRRRNTEVSRPTT